MTDAPTLRECPVCGEIGCEECLKPAPGEQFDHNGIRYHVGWMRDGEFCMWINEQPHGGFKWDFMDFHNELTPDWTRKIYISPVDPREIVQPTEDSFRQRVAELEKALEAIGKWCPNGENCTTPSGINECCIARKALEGK